MISFTDVVRHLESLSIMPKEMPGIHKLLGALNETPWFSTIDPGKVIVVAGTNGKGSTCAILESLLVSAGQNVGFYSSPHLVDTTERIRVQKESITYDHFIQLFLQNKELIEKYQLTHFEALTLMCADYFFSSHWNLNLDYAIFEVGLGGLYDATNAIPHQTSVITALSLDHTNILGSDLVEIARNKFGIVKDRNLVVHHKLPSAVAALKEKVQSETQSEWVPGVSVTLRHETGPRYFVQTPWGESEMNLVGERAAENAATALTVLERLGFEVRTHLKALNQVKWNGRMQRVTWPGCRAPVYLSGDHNPQGIESLLKILKDFTYDSLHIIVGIGKDKEVDAMLAELTTLARSQLYLTETPFKGLGLDEYPEPYQSRALLKDADVASLLNDVSQRASEQDLVLVTGSLYLVGEILKKLQLK